MKLRYLLGFAPALAMFTVTPDAGAWLKFHNDYSSGIWTAHAYASTNGLFCGYDDGCPGDSYNAGWRVKGWWRVEPGGTATVDGETYHNAWHQYYAEADDGAWWGGDASYMPVRNAAYNWCGNATGEYYPQFYWLATSRCCGTCLGWTDNFTLNFTS